MKTHTGHSCNPGGLPGSATATALPYFDYSHDARGEITKIARLDGLTTYYDSDAVGRLTYETSKDAGGATLYAFTYDYDLNRNRTAGNIRGVATYWAHGNADALTERWTVPAGGDEVDRALSYGLARTILNSCHSFATPPRGKSMKEAFLKGNPNGVLAAHHGTAVPLPLVGNHHLWVN